jgi:alginate O-acetyltransferase complex protein AlgI
MLFSSLEFLYFFLPLTVILYFIAPRRLKNGILLVMSMLFYAFGEPKYIFLMMITILANFFFGIACNRERRTKKFCRTFLVIAIAFNVSLLVFFKYFNFLTAPFNFITPLALSLPVGISFYTFQALSYVADVYKNDVEPSKDPISFAAYISLFPQLIAGPIVRYKDVCSSLRSRRHSFDLAAEGIRRFLTGLSKKVLLANPAGEMWERISSFSAEQSGVLGAWLGIIFYAFQIYFDFSGYSDMAIGLGKIFGFEFPENFNYPYVSKSITDFWRRWHITLSSFFREYVYIPLGGNRKGNARTYLNLFAVWSLTGLWHGASVNFIAWGLYYFLILVIEKAFLKKFLDRLPSFIRHLYSLFFILIGWLIFSADTLPMGAMGYLERMFGINAPFMGSYFPYEFIRNIALISIMVLASTPLPRNIFVRLFKKDGLCADVLCILSLVLCTAFLVRSGYNPFLYFRF